MKEITDESRTMELETICPYCGAYFGLYPETMDKLTLVICIGCDKPFVIETEIVIKQIHKVIKVHNKEMNNA